MFAFGHRIQGLVAMAMHGTKPPQKFMLWIDAVGGYWVCMADEVVLGQPGDSGSVNRVQADVPILGDISARHARIRRDGENYVIDALRDVRIDGRPVRQTGWLADGNRIELGESVRLALRRPSPLSATARLDFVSRHRTQPASDGVLLMADTCILGPGPNCHVRCRDWPREVILFRQEDKLFCKTAGAFEIDGIPCQERGLLMRNSKVTGEGFSFCLEEVSGEDNRRSGSA